MQVRRLNPEAEQLSENYFFETLVRLHRSGEGLSYTGVKPIGYPVDIKIIASDESIAKGNLSPLVSLVSKDKIEQLKVLFEKVMSLKEFDVNNVQAGREYVEAYVSFFHYAEGEAEHSSSGVEEAYTGYFGWIFAGIFLIYSIILSALNYEKRKVSRTNHSWLIDPRHTRVKNQGAD
jgi:hypothetical protein